MEKVEVWMATDYGVFVPIREDSLFKSYIALAERFMVRLMAKDSGLQNILKGKGPSE